MYIIASTGSVNRVVDGIIVQCFNLDGIPYRFRIHDIAQRFAFIYLGFKTNADIYHCHEPDLLLAAYLIKVAQKLLRRKKVHIIHEIRDFYLDEKYLDSRLGRFDQMILILRSKWDKMIHRKFDCVIGVEEPKVERANSYGISHLKIAVIENYVPLDLFPHMPKKFNRGNFVLAYSGGLSSLRGVDKIATACVTFAIRNSVRPTLLIIGRFPKRMKNEEQWLFDYCQQNSQFVDLIYLGWVEHTEVPEILAAADVCFALFYSKRYDKVLSTKAGPMKLYEYMALGKPIIATNAPALQQTINAAQCGIIVHPDGGEAAVANAIEFYFKNPRRLQQDGRRGRKAVEQDLNWVASEKKLLNLYRELGSVNGRA